MPMNINQSLLCHVPSRTVPEEASDKHSLGGRLGELGYKNARSRQQSQKLYSILLSPVRVSDGRLFSPSSNDGGQSLKVSFLQHLLSTYCMLAL